MPRSTALVPWSTMFRLSCLGVVLLVEWRPEDAP